LSGALSISQTINEIEQILSFWCIFHFSAETKEMAMLRIARMKSHCPETAD